MINIAKSFNILAISLNVLHNYFNSSTKLFFWDIFWIHDTTRTKWMVK